MSVHDSYIVFANRGSGCVTDFLVFVIWRVTRVGLDPLAVISVAEHNQSHDNSTTDNEASEDHVLHDPTFDNEGSLWYSKC